MGLPVAEQDLSDIEYKLAIRELESTIGRFISILRNMCSERVIAEIITESTSESKNRQKRQVKHKPLNLNLSISK